MTTVLLFIGLIAMIATIAILAIERSNQKELLASSNRFKDYWYERACYLWEDNRQLRQDLKDAVELERLIKDEERDHHEYIRSELLEGVRYWTKRCSNLLADIRDATSLRELRKWASTK